MRGALAICAMGGTLAAVAAQAADRGASVEDFVSVCPAALLAPKEVDAAVGRRELSRPIEAPLSPTYRVAAYASKDSERCVLITRQTFSDAVLSVCQVSGLFTSSEDDIRGLRTKLEAEPLLGPLDGEVLHVPPSDFTALWKRPGAAPLLTVSITATDGMTSLSMTHWDLKAGQ